MALSSVVISISTLALALVWGLFENGVPDLQKLVAESLFLLAFVIPIAAFGITFFGLPVLFVVRRFGWISSIARFKLFGAAIGAAWAIIAGLFLSFRLEALWFTALIGAVNGLLVAWLWLNIVDKFRASQRHQNPIGEAR